MTRPLARLGAAGLVLLTTLATGCGATGGPTGPAESGGSGPAAAPPGPVAVRAQEAQRVFEAYAGANAAADAALDGSAIRAVQTGPLLAESLAEYTVARRTGAELPRAGFRRPTFLIPDARHDRGYPRWFAAVSKWEGREADRTSALHYFVQREPKGPWRAAVASWVVTAPEPAAAPPSAARPGFTGHDPAAGAPQDLVRPGTPVLPPPDRAATGTIRTSSTPAADRAICDTLATSLSGPAGGPRSAEAVAADRRFTPGPFTSGLRSYVSGLADERLIRGYTYRATETGAPVFRLQSGGSLVTCSLIREHRLAGSGDGDTVVFTEGSGTDALLGGGGREWRRVDERSSATAVIAVPARRNEPATVLSCDCYAPQTLSATASR
ncbi:hypothetical protein AB0G74_08155 [Streptomyces sp. NPDC020875]|uniref:hypothetical protein n=1 Tax=Streptomyces sp. NPDC020875 TaxID=3154898 RepID=UPI0033D0E23D